MSPRTSTRVKEESFLMEDLLDQGIVRESALERAAQISSYVTSITLGPNSSFRNDEPLDLTLTSRQSTLRVRNIPEVVNSQRTVKYINDDDLKCMQFKLLQQSNDKRVNAKIRMKLEERLAKENEHNKKVQAQLDLMKVEAEQKFRAKVDALQQQIESTLKSEEKDEMIYQKQRAEMTKKTRKLIEHQEKEMREAFKKLDDHFNKIEQNFSKIISSCSPEMSATVDFCKTQFEEQKAYKSANPSSFEIVKNVNSNAEEICHSLLKALNDFEAKKKAQQKKEKEENETAAKASAQAQLTQELTVHEQKQPETLTEVPHTRQVSPPQSELSVYYNHLMQFINDKLNSTRQLSESPQLEGLRFALKLAVNKPINMLNEKDKSKLQQSFIDLQNLLLGQRVNTSKGAVSIQDHPEACDWTKLRIAEKLIDVCDKKTATLFHVAALAVALCQKFPDFTTFLIAKLMKECPFLVPYKPPQLRGQSDNDFLKSLGYRINEAREPYSQYQSRTTNYAAFLAALCITTSRRNEQARNPFDISFGWKYLINVLNSTPDPTYCHLIEKVLEVAGASLHAAYGKQFVKLMVALKDGYLSIAEKNVDYGMKAAVDRLLTSIAKFFTENRFHQPSGKLIPNYW